MIVVSYDISDNKLRASFAKMLAKNGAIRLQYSVYEVNNTKRVVDNLIVKIDTAYRPRFTGADSVLIFEADNNRIIKMGNAIHRDQDFLYL